MQQHVNIVGIIDIVLGILGVVIGVMLLIAFAIGAGAIGLGGQQGAAGAAAILGSLGVFMAVIVGGLGVLYIVVGVKLRQYASWARIAQIVLAIIGLASFPIGTAFGIYALVIMFNRETVVLFEESDRRRLGQAA